MKYEYRVKWRREDNARNLTRIYQSEPPAVRLSLIVQGRFAEAFPDTDPSAYQCCAGESFGVVDCGCGGVTNAEAWQAYHDRFPPLVDGPHIERREVGEWEAVSVGG